MRKWDEALTQCHAKLSRGQREKLKSFNDSPGDLIKDLKDRIELLKNDTQEGVEGFTELESGLSTISEGLDVLHRAMQPDRVETAQVLKFLLLPLDVCYFNSLVVTMIG